jgi:hypothetical protein
MTDEQSISIGKITTWIGVISSVITIVLTVFNAYTKLQIDAADQRLKEREQELEAKFKERTANIEESKEKTSRYTFVKTLFQDLESNDSKKQALTINLIRLTLTEGEAERFFRGFTNSPNQTLQKVGNEGIAAIQKEKTSSQLAIDKEREGFLSLLNEKFDSALISFEVAERAFPTYHNVSEIADLLRKNKANFSNPEVRRSILIRIIQEYSWGIPDDIKDQIRKTAGV